MNRWILIAAGAVALSPMVALADRSTAPPAAAATAENVKVAQVSPDALLERQAKQDPTVFLLDVRTPEEFAAGHIAGAVNIPYNQVATHLQEIPRDKEVVLYCKSGRRAGLAAESLAASGYTQLAHLEGDIQGWTAAGRPVVSSAPTPAEAK
jgi:rhodanese-related sulfurtransferase